MPFSAKASNCVRSVVRLSDDEVAEILGLSDELQAADTTLTADAAVVAAVKQIIDGLRQPEGAVAAKAPAPVETPQPQAAPSPFSGLGGTPNPGAAVATRVAAENKGGFLKLVDAARQAGDINKNQSDTLKEMATSDDRGMSKAKDELMRLREKASEKRTNEREAGKSWNDEDLNWQEGDPKWGDLSPAQREKWTTASAQNKTTIELYDSIVAEQRAVSALPTTDTEGDIQTIKGVPDEFTSGPQIDKRNPAMGQGKTAAAWLAKNSQNPFFRLVAARLDAVLDADIPIRWSENGAPPSIQRQFDGGAEGVSSLALDGTMRITFRESAQVSEGDLLHELIHSATQRGLVVAKDAALVTEMNVLTKTIQRSLTGMYGDTADMTARHFARVVENPHELLAYGLSSPEFRSYARGLDWNGNRIDPADTAEIAAEAERQAGDAPTMTLWQRFADWARRMIGLAEKHRPAFEQTLAEFEGEKIRYVVANTPSTLFERLDGLFSRALAQQGQTSQREAAIPLARMKGKSSNQAVTPLPKTTNVPDFEPGNRFATTLKDWTGGWKTKPGMLGWMTLRQLADRFKNVKNVTRFADLSAAMSSKAKALMTEAHKVDQTWGTLKRDDMMEMQRLMLESTMDQIWPNRPFESQTHLDLTSASLKAKHAQLAKRFNALSESAKRTYNESQAKMRKDWDERGRLLKLRIIDQYRAELNTSLKGDALDKAGNANKGDRAPFFKGLNKGETRSLNSMFGDIDEHASNLAQMQGPYFPLMRFGQHVVVAKSNDLNQAQDAFVDAQEKLAALNADEDTSADARKKSQEAVKAAQADLASYKDQDKHYIVEFYESPSEANARREQLTAHYAGQGQAMQVYSQRREEHFNNQDSVAPSFMKKLEETLASSLPDKDANAIRMAVRDLYIQAMPDRSALKSQLKRIGVKGVKDGEMRRSFAAASMRSSWHLSRLEHGQEMATILTELRRGESDEERIVGNEFAKRLAGTLQQDVGNLLVDRLTNLSYLTYLGLSPSFFIINAMQPWVISLPIMAGRYGMKRSTVELGRAFTDTGAAMKSSYKDQRTLRFDLDLEKFKDPGERQMLETLFNRGVIDVTIEHDLGSLASGQETTAFGKVMSMSSVPAHHTEVINRVMTALAAYRLASAGGLAERASAEQATRYAEQVVAETHLDYTPENAPRFMRSAALGGLGRIVFQFKKYMQGMIFLMAKMSQDALRGDKEAQKGLAYLMGMQIATAGAVGLPFTAPLGLIASMIGLAYPDDDKPDFYNMIRQGMEDAIGKDATRLALKGIPAAVGADISSRVGFGNILNPFAFVAPGKEGADYVAHAIMGLAGPAVSMGANWAEALSIAKDDSAKAAARALPKFVADPIRAIDRANRGVTNRRGDTLIGPDEFGAMSILMRSVGFESSDVTDMYDKRGEFLEARAARDKVRERLIRQAVNARNGDGDLETVTEKIESFNERHEDDKITGRTITQSAKSRVTTAKDLRDGVAVRKNDRALAERLGIGQ